MIHITKNNKWVIATCLICIFFGVLTFFTFINQSFIKLNDFNLQILLFIDAVFLILFFIIIVREISKILKEKKEGKLGSETSLRYIVFFSATTLLPSVIIAIFSLVLFNVGVEKTNDEQFIFVVSNSTSTTEYRYIKDDKLKLFQKRTKGHKYFVEHLSPHDQIHFDNKIYEYIELNNIEFNIMMKLLGDL